MTPQERSRIISNDYADLLFLYNDDKSILENVSQGVIHIINSAYAVVHIPIEQFTETAIMDFGYSSIPNCYGTLSMKSLEATAVTRLRNTPGFNLMGDDVLLGFVDTGINYTNPIFQKEDGTTRIVSIWDQTIDQQDGHPENIFYGTEFSKEQINQAIQSENATNIVPSIDEIGHGTMMAGIAAGAPMEEEGFSGVAIGSELLVVKLKVAKKNIKDFYRIPQEALCYQENDIMFGVDWILRKARELRKPVVVCLGLGSSQGGHDGENNLSNYLSIVGNIPDVVIVLAGGNEGAGRRHYYGIVDESLGYDTVELQVGPGESGFSMELWGESPSIFSIDILSPSGELIPRIPARFNVSKRFTFLFEETIINVDYKIVETTTGDQLIHIRFSQPSQGIWRFRVYGVGDMILGYHMWLPMEHFIGMETYFLQADPYTTILAPANAIIPICFTAYNVDNESLFLPSSLGYSRTGYVVPTLAAPGVNILAPDLSQGFRPVSGTSAAAAHGAGVAAILVEWGSIRGNYKRMDTVEVKKFLIRGARRKRDLVYPNREWGFGILDIYNVFDALRRDNVE